MRQQRRGGDLEGKERKYGVGQKTGNQGESPEEEKRHEK